MGSGYLFPKRRPTTLNVVNSFTTPPQSVQATINTNQIHKIGMGGSRTPYQIFIPGSYFELATTLRLEKCKIEKVKC